jgi:hypothetical protein
VRLSEFGRRFTALIENVSDDTDVIVAVMGTRKDGSRFLIEDAEVVSLAYETMSGPLLVINAVLDADTPYPQGDSQ